MFSTFSTDTRPLGPQHSLQKVQFKVLSEEKRPWHEHEKRDKSGNEKKAPHSSASCLDA